MAPAVDIVPIRPGSKAVEFLDQRRLPERLEWLEATSAEDVARAIATLAVRGAPAVGVAAVYGLWLAALDAAQDKEHFWPQLRAAAQTLVASRPTAVNLEWAVNRAMGTVADRAVPEVPVALRALADAMMGEDARANQAMGHAAARYLAKDGLPRRLRVLTHCNTGALATAGYGTALGVLRALFSQGALESVYVDETRPLLQGSRLTAFELEQLGIPYTLLVDGAAASLMQSGAVDLVVVGADRIVRNGDTANKIGTYGLALTARAHGIPFYVAAPLSTIDLSLDAGKDIPIEQRNAEEVRRVGSTLIAPPLARVYNPAFDVTPGSLIAAFFTDRGVITPPYPGALEEVVRRHAGHEKDS